MKIKLSAGIATALSRFLLGCVHTAHQQTSSVFQIRLILDAPSGDSQPMIVVSEKTNEAQNVQNTVLLDQAAVKSAGVRTDALGTHGGRPEAICRITREKVGQ